MVRDGSIIYNINGLQLHKCTRKDFYLSIIFDIANEHQSNGTQPVCIVTPCLTPVLVQAGPGLARVAKLPLKGM